MGGLLSRLNEEKKVESASSSSAMMESASTQIISTFERLKEKVRTGGLKSFSEHEVLEYILTYCIPRKDTNELAHKLINHFDGLSGVLDANIDMLKKVDGVGEETALFLSSLPQLFDSYKISKSAKTTYKLSTTGDCVKYFRAKYEIKSKEHFYCILLGATCDVIKVFELVGSGDKINLDIKSNLHFFFNFF